MTAHVSISSRDNPLLKNLRKLAQDSTAYRKEGRVWVEGEHLCSAALVRGCKPSLAVFTESYWPLAPEKYRVVATKNIVIPANLFRDLSTLESPATVGFVLDWTPAPALRADVASVVLDRVQDAGNVGSILRSAAAFGFGQVVALKGTAALWSPKVLRAGMGAHFGLALIEGLSAQNLREWPVPLVVTSSHQGQWLHQLRTPSPCAWVFGHEGQGVDEALMQQASLHARIAQPGGEESLNVAAAAAICLHASATAA